MSRIGRSPRPQPSRVVRTVSGRFAVLVVRQSQKGGRARAALPSRSPEIPIAALAAVVHSPHTVPLPPFSIFQLPHLPRLASRSKTTPALLPRPLSSLLLQTCIPDFASPQTPPVLPSTPQTLQKQKSLCHPPSLLRASNCLAAFAAAAPDILTGGRYFVRRGASQHPGCHTNITLAVVDTPCKDPPPLSSLLQRPSFSAL